MKVRNNNMSSAVPGVSGATGAGPVSRTEAVSRTRRASDQSLDVTTIMGIPESELTPRVKAAFEKLMTEVVNMRQDLERAQKRIGFLEELADQDSLAPVLNRRAFVRELSRMMSFAERYGAPSSVLFFDVNGMKQVNDKHGHGAGDATLKHIASTLLNNVRSSDIVGRLGGDEFGVILAQASKEVAMDKAAQLAAEVKEEMVVWDGQQLDVSVAYGVHTFVGEEEVDEALNAADKAMYEQKRSAAEKQQ
jgi:diguanylate cyclase (GGDEF)-like protein